MSRRCKWCRGTGRNSAHYGPVPCPDCDGTGHVQDECEECGEPLDEDGQCDCGKDDEEDDEDGEELQ